MFFRKKKGLITLGIGSPFPVRPPVEELAEPDDDNPEVILAEPEAPVAAKPAAEAVAPAGVAEGHPPPVSEAPPRADVRPESPPASPVAAAAAGPVETPASPRLATPPVVAPETPAKALFDKPVAPATTPPAWEQPAAPAPPPPAAPQPAATATSAPLPAAGAVPTREFPPVQIPSASAAPKLIISEYKGPEPDVEHMPCTFCFRNIPTTAIVCEYCGNALIAGIEEDEAGPEPIAEIVNLENAEEEAPVPEELDTRRLSSHPMPSILKETTIMIPAQLTLLDSIDRQSEKVFQLKIGITNIGRGIDNEHAFPEEEFLSRHHCQITFHKYQYVIKDMQSANGTFVNDVKIQETILRDGDNIQIGSLRFLFEDPVEKMKKKKIRAAVG